MFFTTDLNECLCLVLGVFELAPKVVKTDRF
jgi:hypothetical protein